MVGTPSLLLFVFAVGVKQRGLRFDYEINAGENEVSDEAVS